MNHLGLGGKSSERGKPTNRGQAEWHTPVVRDADQVRWQSELDQQGSVTFRFDRKRLIRPALICSGISVVGVLLLVWGLSSGSWFVLFIAVLTIGVYGVGYGALLIAAVITAGPVRVDQHGIAWSNQAVAWSEAHSFRTWAKQGRKPILLVDLSPPAYARNKSKRNFLWRQLDKRSARFIGGTSCVVPLNGLDPEAAAHWLNHLRKPDAHKFQPIETSTPEPRHSAPPSGRRLWRPQGRLLGPFGTWTSANRTSNLRWSIIYGLVPLVLFGIFALTDANRTSVATGIVTGSSSVCQVEFPFNGQPVEWTGSHNKGQCGLTVGQSISIYYDPSNPQSATLVGPTERQQLLDFGLATTVLGAGYGAIRWRRSGNAAKK